MISRREFVSAAAVLPFARRIRFGPERRSTIFLQLRGGPAQLDSWDPKPEAPSEIRGPFRAIRTSVPGIQISELFPRMARQAHRFQVIRSVYRSGPPVHDEFPVFSGILSRGSLEQRLLAARRRVEAGAPLVAVDAGSAWDAHGWGRFPSLGEYRDIAAPVFDAAYSTLLEDLAQRGLLGTTLVIAAGEFGRTPRINPSGGRDHWSRCWTVLVAGGGIEGGQVYGASDAHGAEPKERPVEISDIWRLLPETELRATGGRPADQGIRPTSRCCGPAS